MQSISMAVNQKNRHTKYEISNQRQRLWYRLVFRFTGDYERYHLTVCYESQILTLIKIKI
jgi:hypothetical protein